MPTIHIVSHTHWDREWFETFQQFRLKLVRLIDNLLVTLDNQPEYRHFMLDGQTIVLEDYLEIRPEREAELRRHIQAERIQIGPWYILPDEFLVSAEATVRNLLEGGRTAARFGRKMEIGYLPDTFGHIGQMPQILHSFEMDTACVWRGVGDLPCELQWQAPDGSTVLMSFLRDSYSNAKSLTGVSMASFINEITRLRDSLFPHLHSPHILMMNGDDFMEIQPHLGGAIQDAQGKFDDVILHSTLPAYFAGLKKSLDMSQLPVVKGELRSSKLSNLLPNVLSTRIWIKQRNQTCQTLLEKWAEPFSTWATLFTEEGQASFLIHNPEAAIRQAWRLLMQCHPHDSICGCSIDQVHDEMRSRFDQVEQIGEELVHQSLTSLAETVNTQHTAEGIASASMVFNPTQYPRTDLVSASLVGLKIGEQFDMLDEQETSLPYEIIGWDENELTRMILPPEEIPMLLGAVTNGEIQGFRIQRMDVTHEEDKAFLEMEVIDHGQANVAAWEQGRQAIERLQENPQIKTFQLIIRTPILTQVLIAPENVPGHGYRTFWVRKGSGETKKPLQLNINQETLSLRKTVVPEINFPVTIQNEFLSVEVQPDGLLDLLDKRTGVLYSGLNRFVDVGDRGDEYTYSPTEDGELFSTDLLNVQVQHCSIWQRVEIDMVLTIPAHIAGGRKIRSQERVAIPLKTSATLVRGVPRLDIHTEVVNQAEDHRLRVHFPAPFAAESATHDGHFEIVQRPVELPPFDETWFEEPRPEVPQNAFTAIDNGKIGLLLANRGLPEVEVLKKPDGTTEIALTLLRCVGWLSRSDFPERTGHAGPGKETPDAQMKGVWSFDYAVVPFAASEKLSSFHQAYAFQVPLRTVSTGIHDGKLPGSGSFLQVEPAEFNISTIKAAEDGQGGWIARGYNLSDDSINIKLQSRIRFSAAEKVNLAEKAVGQVEKADETTIHLQARGKEIISIKFTDYAVKD